MKLVILLLIPIALLGQVDTVKKAEKNYKACFFLQDNPLLSLSKKLNENFDVRLMFNFNFSHQEYDFEDSQTEIYKDTTYIRTQTASTRTISSYNSISLIFAYYYVDLQPFDFYLALGPRFGINYLDNSTGHGYEYLYGVIGITGIEYEVNENIFFLGEYQVNYFYLTSKLERVRNYSGTYPSKVINVRKKETWSTQLSNLKIGIGIKF